MIEVKTEIILSIKRSLRELTKEEIKFLVERPENESFGDYSSNIALTLFANSKLIHLTSSGQNSKFGSPMKLAEEIVKKLNSSRSGLANVDRVEAVAPGFINFWLSKEYLVSQLSLISNKTPLRPFGSAQGFAGRRIMVEFTDPNPFKEFHIGHLYSNTVGESLCRILEVQGAIVRRVCYQGDVGLHIAKVLYGIQNSESRVQNLDEKSLKEKIKFLGEAYALGAKAYEDDERAKKEIEELNKKIYDKDPAIMSLYEKGRQWSLGYFESIYKRLGTKFDFYYFESEVGKEGLKLVKEYLKKGVFEESQGAVIFPGEKYGLHTRVFINSLGLPTYEAKDLGLAPTKYKDFAYDLSIIITAQEQSSYFKVVIKALSLINPELGRKTRHISHGVVRLPSGKMSSRSGNVLTGEWLLDETKKLLKSKYSEMEEETLEKVAVGSVKYALLKSSIGHDIEFDFEESINIQGNSGPYLQYTFARTQSVLNKLKIKNKKLKIDWKFEIGNLKLEIEEKNLLRSIARFCEVVAEAGEKFSPNLLCNYLFDLAQKFNLFYQKCRIIGSENQDFRLALAQGVGQVIKNGLNLLGIQAPEKM